MEFRKMVMITLYAKQKKKKDTDVQNRLLDSVGEGEGGRFWEKARVGCFERAVSKHVYYQG